MRKYLSDYINYVDNVIKSGKVSDDFISMHLDKIRFFQHERLIHLLVTLFYAVFILISIIISYFINLFLIIVYILLIFLIFYVRHYFFLENGVQYLYKQYDSLKNL